MIYEELIAFDLIGFVILVTISRGRIIWKTSHQAQPSTADLFWETVRRCIVFSFYGFGCLHLVLVITVYLAWVTAVAILISPFVGLVQGLLAGLISILTGYNSPKGLLFFVAIVAAGALAWALGGIAMVAICYTILDNSEYAGEIKNSILFWAGIYSVIGVVVSGRLVRNLRQPVTIKPI